MKKIIWLLALLILLSGCQMFNKDQSQQNLDKEGPYVQLTDEMQKKISDAWLEKEGVILDWEAEGPEEVRYYGTFGDCVAFFVSGQTTAISSKTVAGYTFQHTSSFQIYVYDNGSFCTLEEAYTENLLTKEQIGLIAEYHVAFYDDVLLP